MTPVSVGTAQIGLYACGSADRVGAMYEFNCFNFRDPMSRDDLRKLTGKDSEVQSFIAKDPKIPALLDHASLLIYDMIKVHKNPFISLLFRDHHGKWIARGIVELLIISLQEEDYHYHVLDYANKEF